MIFGGEEDQEDCWRYSTWEEAEAGHEAVMRYVRGEGSKP